MRMVTFDAIGKHGETHRIRLDAVSIVSVEETTEQEKSCILRGRRGETHVVRGTFATITEQLSPPETGWTKTIAFLNTKVGTVILTGLLISLGGAFLKFALQSYTEDEQKLAHERSLLIDFDSRLSQMAAREAQIDTFPTDAGKGSTTLCIYHLAAGDGICDSTDIPGNPKKPLQAIVNELTGLRVGVDPRSALNTLGAIETQLEETAVQLPDGSVTRLYPLGVLNKELDSLRKYSNDVWDRIGGHY